VQRWLAAIGDKNIARYPPLAVTAGWEAVLTGATARAERWAAVVDAASFDGEPPARCRSAQPNYDCFRTCKRASPPT
jgi:LuxR family maltose regulon positive regulatory protein